MIANRIPLGREGPTVAFTRSRLIATARALCFIEIQFTFHHSTGQITFDSMYESSKLELDER